MSFDLLLKECKVFDGTGNPWYWADIGIKGGSIAAIAPPNALSGAGRTLNLEGRAVAPGFIDPHSHSDFSFLVDRGARSKLRQGVTTELVGNCGVSAVPLHEDLGFLKELFEQVDRPNWEGFAQFFDRLEGEGLPLNLASLVGHGSLRAEAMGFAERPPTREESERMKENLARGMEEGALGLSTGLYYAPGSYAETEEVIELARVAARYGGIYATHIRNEGKELAKAVKEAIEIGRQAELPVQISHHKAVGKENWGKVEETLELIEQARAEGIDVTCDQYPYRASSTTLSSLLPRWVHEGGKEKLLGRLRDEGIRQEIEEELGETKEMKIDWSQVVLAEGLEEKLLGKTVAEVAEERGKRPGPTALDIISEKGLEGEVKQVTFEISEEDIEKVMRAPFVMVSSDGSSLNPEGPLGKGKPHPRNYGAFPRVLGEYVREKGVLSLEEGIRKMTSLTANRLGLAKKGLVKIGLDADLVVFSPAKVTDRATFAEPAQFPKGISHVVVGGAVAVEDGETRDLSGGRVLRGRFS